MIDLRSDTVTTPDERMREAARDADVGDDVYVEDPSVNELERRAADAVGMEDALFVPTGTMGNQVAAMTHTDHGQEIVAERESHIVKWELAGLAQLAGLQVRMIDGDDRGAISPDQIRESCIDEDLHRPGTGLVALENTHNSKGGAAISPERIDEVAETAHELGVPVHLDGARVFNAAVAHDVPASRMVESVDSVMFCLSKGLGAPVGSIVAGSEAFIEDARRNRKLLGGGMRQVGVIAAPALHALENVDRLEEDHENARTLAAGLDGVGGLSVAEPETNIVLVETAEAGLTASEFLDRCSDEGLLGTQFGDHTVRFCTHLDADSEDIDGAIDRVERALA